MNENDLIKDNSQEELIDINSMLDIPITPMPEVSVNNVENSLTPDLIMDMSPVENEVKPLPDVSITPDLPPETNTSNIVTSGTATEEDILKESNKEKVEVLDEYEIKQEIVNEDKKYKKNFIFIAIVVILIVAFIILLPLITKKIGL
ncbi:MAG TPA: hypothetical protein PLV83_00375 [Bacilli bacterium]|nr:hypothetical protein [Bacilli bacterium]